MHDASFPDAVHQRAAAARVAATHLPDAYAPPPPSRPSVLAVAVATTLMALCTGLGAAPYLAMGSLPPATAARATAAAAGVMLAASFDLLHEGEPYGAAATAAGAVVGAAFIRAVQSWLEDKEHLRLACGGGGGAVVVAVMAAHAVGEGAGVGVSFCGARGVAQGALVAVAIAIHNLGEGCATAAALRSRGVPPRATLAWTLVTAAPQPLMAVPAFLFVDTFKALLPGALGFAAGCMTWLAAAELLPSALAAAPAADVGTAVTLAAAALEAVRMALATLERPDGSLAPPPVWRSPAAGARAALAAASLAAPLAAVAGGLTALAVADATPAGASTLGLSAGVLAAVGGAGVVRALLSTPAAAAAACGGAVAAVLMLRARSPPRPRQGRRAGHSSRRRPADNDGARRPRQAAAAAWPPVTCHRGDSGAGHPAPARSCGRVGGHGRAAPSRCVCARHAGGRRGRHHGRLGDGAQPDRARGDGRGGGCCRPRGGSSGRPGRRDQQRHARATRGGRRAGCGRHGRPVASRVSHSARGGGAHSHVWRPGGGGGHGGGRSAEGVGVSLLF